MTQLMSAIQGTNLSYLRAKRIGVTTKARIKPIFAGSECAISGEMVEAEQGAP